MDQRNVFQAISGGEVSLKFFLKAFSNLVILVWAERRKRRGVVVGSGRIVFTGWSFIFPFFSLSLFTYFFFFLLGMGKEENKVGHPQGAERRRRRRGCLRESKRTGQIWIIFRPINHKREPKSVFPSLLPSPRLPSLKWVTPNSFYLLACLPSSIPHIFLYDKNIEKPSSLEPWASGLHFLSVFNASTNLPLSSLLPPFIIN